VLSWQVVGWTSAFNFYFYFNNFYSTCLVPLNWTALLPDFQSRVQISYGRPTIKPEVFFVILFVSRDSEVQNEWICTSTSPIRVHSIYRDNFTFPLAYCLHIMWNSLLLLTNLSTIMHNILITNVSLFNFCEDNNNNNNNLVTECNPSFPWDYFPINPGVWTTDNFVKWAVAINA